MLESLHSVEVRMSKELSGPIRLMVVDDMKISRESIREILEPVDDIEIIAEATTGLEAIELYGRLRPDVVSMDTHMPEMDGITATRRIVERYPEANIFILSVHSQEKYLPHALLDGARDFLTVPPSPEELIEVIRLLHRRPRPTAAAKRYPSPIKGRDLKELTEKVKSLERRMAHIENQLKSIRAPAAPSRAPIREKTDLLSEILFEVEAVSEKYFNHGITMIRTRTGWKAFFGLPTAEVLQLLEPTIEPATTSFHKPTEPYSGRGKASLKAELRWLLADLHFYRSGYKPMILTKGSYRR
jgi:DNA-binding NarL/FixJ family response regulator